MVQERDSISPDSAIILAEKLAGFDSLSLGLVIAEMDTEIIELQKYMHKWKQAIKVNNKLNRKDS
jgi:hypothetical protein